MMSAASRQAEATASGATAIITAQIADLGPRPVNGHLAESRPSRIGFLGLTILSILALTMIVMLFRFIGTMEYRRSVNHYCMSGPASRCPDYPRTPGKFSNEIDPNVPVRSAAP
ncbi:MAG: hypothetical protein E5X33_20135 [Mesorhizobium sp.]|uniref:hypothetical protein n=1 Tax=Mesorhizobium sp. TaxID=1871066 RepID=UPI00120C4E4F|nr:hypothetical protein [Mesorhizobium sp.]TIR19439.1 MAG: hypothetical protein E5X33_20135 [Mesorhizobium sp.]